ncbi:RasGEF domain family protein [Aspergillus niger]|uniref:RasGEF domain family protein n=1 Tax=Aspergillus niger TaxID=5061 RepID=A0A505I5R6_ASPNG|nr:RasGEF domain family protein [Aspergillus niger]
MPPKGAPRRGAPAGAASRANASTTASASPAPSATTTGDSQTPTPGPSASGRAPVQRLQSLKKRTPSGSIGPAAKPPGAPAAPGEPAKPTLKYKPRAVGRRSKEEREAIEKLEAERHRERLKEAAAIQRGRDQGGPGGRGGFGRGRGGPLGSAGGPLGSGMSGRRGRGGRFGQDSRHSSMSRRSRSVIDLGNTAAGAGTRDYSSDESDGEVRISIDQINLDSDEEDQEQMMVDSKKGKAAVKYADAEKGLRPIRVERHEHEERVDDGALFVQQNDDDAAATTEGEPKVKSEPTDDDDQVMTDVPHAEEPATTDDGLLPVQKVKVRRKITPPSNEATPQPEMEIPAAVKDPKSLLRTKEDIEEYERHEQDLEIVKDLFQKEPEPEKSETTTPAEGEAPALFLMQFPPMTPNLVVPGNNENPADEATDAMAGQSAPEASGSEQTGVKREDGVEILEGGEDATATGTSSKIVTATDWGLSAGRVGKLNVHASGRVTMDWGGISFELDRATAVDFLQEALIVSTPPNAADEEFPDDEKKVWAMGQLSGKFTVTPDWGKML